MEEFVALFESQKGDTFQQFRQFVTYLCVNVTLDLDLDSIRIIIDQQLLRPPSLLTLWTHAFNQFTMTNIITQCYPILHFVRILSNKFGGQAQFLFSIPQYYAAITTSLLNTISQLNPSQLRLYSYFITELPREMLIFYIDNLMNTLEPVQFFIKSMDGDWCLEAFLLAAHLITKRNLPYQVPILIQLLARSCQETPPESICKRLFFNKTFDSNIARIIINSLPTDYIADICYHLCRIWGDRIYISSGRAASMAYMFAGIDQCLDRMTKSDLTASWNETTLMALLSRCISNYLDAGDAAIRKYGMELAKVYAAKLDTQISFDAPKPAPPTESAAPRRKLTVDVDPDEGSDSDGLEELDAYYDPELVQTTAVHPEDKYTRLYYLSVCLQKLRTPSEDKDAYTNHRNALCNIPEIVVIAPTDAADLCGPLLKELLRLSNSFNMEKFDDLREKAMDALLFGYPQHCVSVIEWALETPDALCIGTKMEMLGAMVRAAYALSSVKTTDLFSHQEASDSPLALPKATGETLTDKKTVVKRPLRLAAMKKKTIFYQNRFLPVALAFFKSVATVMQTFITSTLHRSPLFEVKPEVGDGIDTLVPCQCFLAMIAFIRSTIHHPYQSKIVEETVQYALLFKESSALSIRRNATATLLIGVEALLLPKAARPKQFSSPLQALKNLTVSEETPNGLVILPEHMTLIGTIVEWCMTSHNSDPDEHCRLLKKDIIAKAITGLEKDQH